MECKRKSQSYHTQREMSVDTLRLAGAITETSRSPSALEISLPLVEYLLESSARDAYVHQREMGFLGEALYRARPWNSQSKLQP